MKIYNETLVELGFPDIILENTFFWKGGWNTEKIVEKFYECLYCLAKIYEKIMNSKLDVRKEGHIVYLNNIRVFSLTTSSRNTYKSQNLHPVKNIIKQLLTKISLEELKEKIHDIKEEILRKIMYICLDSKELEKRVISNDVKKLVCRHFRRKSYEVLEIINGTNFDEEWKVVRKRKMTISQFFKSGTHYILDTEIVKTAKNCDYLVLRDEEVVQKVKEFVILSKL